MPCIIIMFFVFLSSSIRPISVALRCLSFCSYVQLRALESLVRYLYMYTSTICTYEMRMCPDLNLETHIFAMCSFILFSKLCEEHSKEYNKIHLYFFELTVHKVQWMKFIYLVFFSIENFKKRPPKYLKEKKQTGKHFERSH